MINWITYISFVCFSLYNVDLIFLLLGCGLCCHRHCSEVGLAACNVDTLASKRRASFCTSKCTLFVLYVIWYHAVMTDSWECDMYMYCTLVLPEQFCIILLLTPVLLCRIAHQWCFYFTWPLNVQTDPMIASLAAGVITCWKAQIKSWEICGFWVRNIMISNLLVYNKKNLLACVKYVQSSHSPSKWINEQLWLEDPLNSVNMLNSGVRFEPPDFKNYKKLFFSLQHFLGNGTAWPFYSALYIS